MGTKFISMGSSVRLCAELHVHAYAHALHEQNASSSHLNREHVMQAQY